MKTEENFYIFKDEQDIKECEELFEELKSACSKRRVDIALGVVVDLAVAAYAGLPFIDKDIFLKIMAMHWDSLK